MASSRRGFKLGFVISVSTSVDVFQIGIRLADERRRVRLITPVLPLRKPLGDRATVGCFSRRFGRVKTMGKNRSPPGSTELNLERSRKTVARPWLGIDQGKGVVTTVDLQ